MNDSSFFHQNTEASWIDVRPKARLVGAMDDVHSSQPQTTVPCKPLEASPSNVDFASHIAKLSAKRASKIAYLAPVPVS